MCCVAFLTISSVICDSCKNANSVILSADFCTKELSDQIISSSFSKVRGKPCTAKQNLFSQYEIVLACIKFHVMLLR